jgi:hypothetical protein
MESIGRFLEHYLFTPVGTVALLVAAVRIQPPSFFNVVPAGRAWRM